MFRLTHTLAEVDKQYFVKSTVRQRLEVSVNYNPFENTYDLISIKLFENSKPKAEVSKLLLKGMPLQEILDSIDWSEVYKENKRQADNFFTKHKGFFSFIQKLTL